VSEPVWLRESTVLIAQETTIAIHGGSPGIRDRGLLESAMARPRNLYQYESPDLCALAAAYTAGIVKNHPFVDGNKRAGFLAGAAFLDLNGMQFSASEAGAAQMIFALAAGEISESRLAHLFRENSVGPE
jgi:death-on-curing protein